MASKRIREPIRGAQIGDEEGDAANLKADTPDLCLDRRDYRSFVVAIVMTWRV